MKANDFVRLALESPLHIFLGNLMLITVIGRRTGRPITTPVNYYRDGNALWILSKRSRQWWRNIRSSAAVRLHLHGREIPATAELVLDEKSVAAGVGAYVRHLPGSARALGVKSENGVPDARDLEQAAQGRLLVKVSLGRAQA